MLRKKIRVNEEYNIEWNKQLFQGMTYLEIKEFKEKNKHLVIQQYKLAVKKAQIEAKLLEQKDAFLAGNKKNKKYKVVATAGSIAIATVCLAATVSFAQDNTNKNFVTTNKAVTTIEEVAATNEASTNPIENINIVVDENCYNIETASEEIETVSTYDTEDTVSYTYEDSYNCEYVSVEEHIAPLAPYEEEVLLDTTENYVEDDIIIFDKAMEMIMSRCEESQNGTVFRGDYKPQFVQIMGTFIHPYYNDSADFKVGGWFERFFGNEATTYSLRYNSSFSIKEGGAHFENTVEGFKVFIDKNSLNLKVDLDIDDAIEASIRGGVSKDVRNYLLSEECQSFLPSLTKMMDGLHSNVKNDILKDENLYDYAKESIEQELKSLTSWDVTVVFY